ncbi:fibronectin type III domain-containing protein, partial [Flavobacterium sp.]|uniref:fibronectin type III domain-containing protein n=1 Tax=Flavobacterium sp. TaxID=239 RepID=UPI0038FCB7CB
MKKITLLLAFMLAIVTEGYSQVSGYAFSGSTEAYTAVVGTGSSAAGDDGIENGIPIGFTFKYDGVDYTHFCVSTNGWIKMGDAATTGNTGTANYSNAFSPTASNRPLIAPFWDDNNLGTGNIQYAITGTAPNRILEVGWDNVNIGGSGSTSTTAFASYKLRLYETTNVIDFVYGSVMDAAGTLSASVGLNGSSSFLSVTPSAASTASSSTANNSISATTNLVGKKYTFTPPTCSAPGGLAVSTIATTSATISWTAVVPTPATGYEYVVSTSNTTPVVSGTATTAVSIPLTGLLPATTYYVFVRSNCGSGFSAWSSSVAFATLCVSVTAFTENFDSVTAPNFPVCWARVGTGGNTNIQTTNPSSGVNTMYLYGFTGSLGVVKMVPISNMGAGTHRLRFKMRGNFTAGDDVEVGYLTDPNDDATFIAFTSFNASTLTYADFSYAPVAGTYSDNLAFRHTGNLGLSVLIDDVVWEPVPVGAPACVTLTTPANGATSVSSSQVTWASNVDATGYKIKVGTTLTGSEFLASTDVLNVTTYNLGALASGTTYYVTITPYNATGDAIGCTASSFTTCASNSTLPWIENFDALATGTNIFPSCWAYTNASSTWSISTAPVAHSGANSLRRTWGTDGWAFTPKATLTAGTSYTFSYFVRTNDTTVGYDITLGVGTAQTDVAMTTILSTQAGYQDPAWTLVTNEFTPTVSGDYSFGINVVADFAPNGINFDDFKLEVTPACVSPNPTVSNITSTSADMAWSAISGAVNYEYVLDNVVTNPAGSGTLITPVTYLASGLTPGTQYYFHVRTNCGAGFSTWSTITFTTLPSPPVNDNCSGATVLIPAADYATGSTVGTIVGATDSSTEPVPSCASYVGGDV